MVIETFSGYFKEEKIHWIRNIRGFGNISLCDIILFFGKLVLVLNYLFLRSIYMGKVLINPILYKFFTKIDRLL